eukprot:NODE_2457_length_1171_cov_21.766284_g2341_i0.p2 GENE.NODE_2457_length_1171_cov_21.766284_g2341_i0~~NODE_2457_length_1171_cov_21.766284_g2341_i0.p2  ORF type:complete len:365 (-),score=99.26 NODE_2457_length_1171_cov_21.766284_g2341_i0:65-1159(-)
MNPKTGCRYFRQNIIVATMSGKEVQINDIRPKDTKPGLKDYEGNFLKLINRLTNGCRIVINDVGTRFTYRPGVITGGIFQHECHCDRGMGYWLEALMLLAPFAKQPTKVTLTGVTNHPLDIGVDVIRLVTIPLLGKFGVHATLKIERRGAAPLGGGRVVFTCEPVRSLTPAEFLYPGKVKRIRGLSYSARLSPELSNRCVRAAKGVMLELLPDVFITTDHFTGEDAGLSSGYGIALVAESTSKGNTFVCEEIVPTAEEIEKTQMTPEDVGTQVAHQLLEQLNRGGCIDTTHQVFALFFMALCPERLCRNLMGQLTDYSLNLLLLLEEHFGVSFQLLNKKRGTLPDSVMVQCIGTDYINLVKRST